MCRHFLIIFHMLICLSCVEIQSDSNDIRKLQLPDIEEYVPSATTILFGGDYMQHLPQLTSAQNSDGSYDFLPTLRYMDSLWSSADLVALNFETTIGSGSYTGYPVFKSPVECMSALKQSGVDLIFTANNHCCDGGRRGLARTIDCADSLELLHVGTYRDSMDYEKSRVLFVNSNGIEVAFMNYTYGTNGLPVPKGQVVGMIDTNAIKRDLELAARADVKIVVMHWGWEYARTENFNQRALGRLCREWGADFVVGAHPHVVQPADLYWSEDSSLCGGVFYSLGNFISNQREQYKDGGLCVKLYILKDIDGNLVFGVESVPVWVRKYIDNHKYRYEVLPAYLKGKVPMSAWDSIQFERSVKENELHICDIFV